MAMTVSALVARLQQVPDQDKPVFLNPGLSGEDEHDYEVTEFDGKVVIW